MYEFPPTTPPSANAPTADNIDANVETTVATIDAIAAIDAGNGIAAAPATPEAIASACFAPIKEIICGITCATMSAIEPTTCIAAAADSSPAALNACPNELNAELVLEATEAATSNFSACLSNLLMKSSTEDVVDSDICILSPSNASLYSFIFSVYLSHISVLSSGSRLDQSISFIRLSRAEIAS